MSKKWGVIFIFAGVLLVLSPWLGQFFSRLPEYTMALLTFIYHHKTVLERIFPASLILLGFAILTKGFLRRFLVFIAFIVAFLSIIALIPTGHGLVSEKKIEFFAGDLVVEWEQGSWKGILDGFDLDGFEVVKVKGNSLDVEFFAGSVKVYLPEENVNVNVEGGVGEIRIFAPKNVKVEVEGDLGIGNFKNSHVAVNPEHTARINYELGIGEVKIE
ncbi:MAG: hypothetical protein H0Z28_10580 [Archaeoglobus sp.]|nr:hypothetical protein [Archaeoglobus sp.]